MRGGPTVDDVFPNIVGTTQDADQFDLYEYLANSWALITCHPNGFNPVCTTGIGEIIKAQDQFRNRGVKVLSFVCSAVPSVRTWVQDIYQVTGGEVKFPIFCDHDRKCARKLGLLLQPLPQELLEYEVQTSMAQQEQQQYGDGDGADASERGRKRKAQEDEDGDKKQPAVEKKEAVSEKSGKDDVAAASTGPETERKPPPSASAAAAAVDTTTGGKDAQPGGDEVLGVVNIRRLYVLRPDRRVAIVLALPSSTGANLDEVFRMLDSLQLTLNMNVATPVNWRSGDDVIVNSDVTDEQADEIFGKDGYRIQAVPSETSGTGNGRLKQHRLRWTGDPTVFPPSG